MPKMGCAGLTLTPEYCNVLDRDEHQTQKWISENHTKKWQKRIHEHVTNYANSHWGLDLGSIAWQ